MTNQGGPFVPASLVGEAVDHDGDPPTDSRDGNEGDMLDLDKDVAGQALEQRKQDGMLRPDLLPHLGIDETSRGVHGARDRVMDEVFIPPPVGTDAEK